ncbi:hypothetical protein D3C87_1410270 [compost metagenome]
MGNQAKYLQFPTAQRVAVHCCRRLVVDAVTAEQGRLTQSQFTHGLLLLAAPCQLQARLQCRGCQFGLADQVRHFADSQLQFRFQRQHCVLLCVIEQGFEPFERLLRLLQSGLGKHQ